MVKIWFDDPKKEKEYSEYVDVSIWSLVKANILSSLLLGFIIYGSIFLLYLLLSID